MRKSIYVNGKFPESRNGNRIGAVGGRGNGDARGSASGPGPLRRRRRRPTGPEVPLESKRFGANQVTSGCGRASLGFPYGPALCGRKPWIHAARRPARRDSPWCGSVSKWGGFGGSRPTEGLDSRGCLGPRVRENGNTSLGTRGLPPCRRETQPPLPHEKLTSQRRGESARRY